MAVITNLVILLVALLQLYCVVMAGVFGAMTVSKKILYIQAMPAVVALALLFALALNWF